MTYSRRPVPRCSRDGSQGPVNPFYDPIPLPRGRQLVTLKNAADHITKLPKVEHESAPWQAAIEALIMAAENRGPLMHARIGVIGRVGSMSKG